MCLTFRQVRSALINFHIHIPITMKIVGVISQFYILQLEREFNLPQCRDFQKSKIIQLAQDLPSEH